MLSRTRFATWRSAGSAGRGGLPGALRRRSFVTLLTHRRSSSVVNIDGMSLPSLSRRQALVGALILTVMLLVAGRILAREEEAPGLLARPIALAPAPAPRLVVHVVGAVRRPGLYRLREGNRTADAVSRAGGATRRADLAGVNLAAPVVDGAQVVIPSRPVASTGAPADAAPSSAGEAAEGPVRLNTATLEQLDTLPGVGPVTAQKIVAFRQEHGAFLSVDELDAVPGIGPARLAELRKVVAP